MERNIFYRRRGRWNEAHEAARSPYETAHWRQFFGWPPPLDTARLSDAFVDVFQRHAVAIADTVDNGNALLRFLR